MAGSGMLKLRKGTTKGLRAGDNSNAWNIEQGWGTPTHAGVPNQVYVKGDATMGTTSHYRRHATATAVWSPMSDD